MAYREIFYKRTWINKKKGKASIETGLDIHVNHNGKLDSLDPTLSISDCDKSIRLDLYINSTGDKRGKAEYDNVLYKLNTLINEITNLRDRIQSEVEREEE